MRIHERTGIRKAACAVVAVSCAVLGGCLGEPAPFDGAALGQVTDHNTAVMVDRLSDLDMPRRDKPRDSARRDAAIAAWRGTGQPAAGAASAPGGSRP